MQIPIEIVVVSCSIFAGGLGYLISIIINMNKEKKTEINFAVQNVEIKHIKDSVDKINEDLKTLENKFDIGIDKLEKKIDNILKRDN